MTVLFILAAACALSLLLAGGVFLGWRLHQVWLDNGGRDD